MAVEFRMPHDVVYYEADVTGKLSLPMVYNLAILSSTQQAIELGIGPDYTHDKGVGWVVLQQVVTIKRRPKDGEKIILATTAKQFNPFFARRQYRLLDADDHKLVVMESLFSMIDMDKRKLARIPKDMAEAYQPEHVRKIPRLADVSEFDESQAIDYKKEYEVRYLDIDSNHHVNNSKYADWMVDVLPLEFLTSHEPTAMNIKYEHEVLPGNQVKSEVQVVGNTTKHRIMFGETVSAEATIDWTLVNI
ncbi:acyl-[acyl-carrier-protein] thioesterase [Weissella sagaensis]|uniref:acyl-[acyl-carrier-protein] thioesterase n=1 Tax=Weissella sagaensis TaxID=2559928 RepID=UPI0013EC40C4|nr:acyl-ACP thioesterase domain-containing protein [Weissella sagaensis]